LNDANSHMHRVQNGFTVLVSTQVKQGTLHERCRCVHQQRFLNTVTCLANSGDDDDACVVGVHVRQIPTRFFKSTELLIW
jgi:hypothetical protein